MWSMLTGPQTSNRSPRTPGANNTNSVRICVPAPPRVGAPTNAPPVNVLIATGNRQRDEDGNTSINPRPRRRNRQQVDLTPRNTFPLDGTCCSCSRHARCSSDPRTQCECRKEGTACTTRCHSRCCLNKPFSDSGGAPTTPAAVTHLSPSRAGHYRLFGGRTTTPRHEAQRTPPNAPTPGGDGAAADDAARPNDHEEAGEPAQPPADAGAATDANGDEPPQGEGGNGDGGEEGDGAEPPPPIRPHPPPRPRRGEERGKEGKMGRGEKGEMTGRATAHRHCTHDPPPIQTTRTPTTRRRPQRTRWRLRQPRRGRARRRAAPTPTLRRPWTCEGRPRRPQIGC